MLVWMAPVRARPPLALLLLLAACDDSKPATRPVPTPGPQVVVKQIVSVSGKETVSRGERVRFAVAGTGAGTHFSASTFVDSKAFTDLRVVAVVSSTLLYAQGTISVIAAEGHKDLAVVSGAELAIDPWAFVVDPKPATIALGAPPVTATGAVTKEGEVALFQLTPKDSGLRTIVIRVDRDPAAPPDFEPSLEIYDAEGKPLARPARGCAAIEVRSRAPLFVRIADPLRRGGENRRFTIAALYGQPFLCVTDAVR